jgi:hypothetical protein
MTTQGRAAAPCAAGGLGGSAWARRHNFKLAVGNLLNQRRPLNVVRLRQFIKGILAALDFIRFAPKKNREVSRLVGSPFCVHMHKYSQNILYSQEGRTVHCGT